MSVKSSEKDKACRICGSVGAVYVDITKPENVQYLKKIHKLLPVKISSSDKLPKNLCHHCLLILDEFDKFYDKCMIVQKELDAACLSNVQLVEGEELANNNCIDAKSGQNENLSKSTLRESSDERGQNESSVTGPTKHVKEAGGIKCPGKSRDVANNEGGANDGAVAEWLRLFIPQSGCTVYVCRGCSTFLFSEKDLPEHTCSSVDSQLAAQDNSEDVYVCEYCDRVFKRLVAYQQHAGCHTGAEEEDMEQDTCVPESDLSNDYRRKTKGMSKKETNKKRARYFFDTSDED